MSNRQPPIFCLLPFAHCRLINTSYLAHPILYPVRHLRLNLTSTLLQLLRLTMLKLLPIFPWTITNDLLKLLIKMSQLVIPGSKGDL